MLHSICQQTWKTQQWPQDWKRSVFFLIPKKGNAKECSNYCVVALISLTSKVMIKLLQARHLEPRISDAQAGLEKVEETKIKLPVSVGSPKNARDFKT